VFGKHKQITAAQENKYKRGYWSQQAVVHKSNSSNKSGKQEQERNE
jgi:hypothetical protein